MTLKQSRELESVLRSIDKSVARAVVTAGAEYKTAARDIREYGKLLRVAVERLHAKVVESPEHLEIDAEEE